MALKFKKKLNRRKWFDKVDVYFKAFL